MLDEDQVRILFDTKLLDELKESRRNYPSGVRPRQVTVTRALHGGYVPDAEEEEYRRVKQATRLMIEEHILDVKAERKAAAEYKDAREMWDEINFQPLPIAAEEVAAPRAWRICPTGHEVRVALMIAVFVLIGIAFLVTR